MNVWTLEGFTATAAGWMFVCGYVQYRKNKRLTAEVLIWKDRAMVSVSRDVGYTHALDHALETNAAVRNLIDTPTHSRAGVPETLTIYDPAASKCDKCGCNIGAPGVVMGVEFVLCGEDKCGRYRTPKPHDAAAFIEASQIAQRAARGLKYDRPDGGDEGDLDHVNKLY